MKDIYADSQKMGKKSLLGQLEQQLEKSKAALAQMETNRTNEVVDNIFDIMLAVDEDQDFSLSDVDIDAMILKTEGIMNVEVDGEAFKKKLLKTGEILIP